jgi:hypothetical protein
MEYYERAIAHMSERLDDPRYFVFSDDVEFARENLPRSGGLEFVAHNDDFSAHEDLRLMSSCHHHILANSTFSWWGAWLNGHPEKIVVAPRQWYEGSDNYYPNLFAPEWTLLDVARVEAAV